MSFTSGTRIGPYEIVSPLGAGGMGEVCRARDTRLDRDVAIKILPAVFSQDAERLARFEREAKTLAALNHPHIAQIYGIEHNALVMELVEGEDLSERIARGAIPVADALAIARQIADALEAAHERGIIHRDLKPANIKVRDDGAVKVLDFGLAKAMDAGREASVDFMNSPTITSPATQMGMIIGTAAYMAPEQAKGRAIDRRADVWAFGVVLFEMLTGKRVFEGGDITEVLASVIKDTPPHDALPAGTPPAIRRLLRRCLEKNPSKRLDSMAAARMEIDDALGAPDAVETRPAAGMSMGRAAMIGGIAVTAAALLGGGAVWRLTAPAPGRVHRLSLTPLPAKPLQIEVNHHDVVVARDGSRVIYWDRVAQGDNRFVVRPLGEFSGTAIDGGPNARGMSVSPDGGWLVYQSGAPTGAASFLQKISIAGGTPQRLTPIEGNLRGATWTESGTIVFATGRVNQGLMRIPASGGTLEVLTTPDAKAGEVDHLWPSAVPGGKHVLFVIQRSGANYDVAVLDLAAKAWRVLVPAATMPRYAASGHLLYSSNGVLHGARFDAAKGVILGEAAPLVDGVLTKESGAANYDVADNGTLVYMAGTHAGRDSVLTWIDRSGKRTPVKAPGRQYRVVRISPDGLKAAVTIDENGAITAWILDLERETLSRLAPAEMGASSLAWSPDSRMVALGVSAAGADTNGLYLAAASGIGVPQRLTQAGTGVRHVPTHWTAQGILFVEAKGPGVNTLRVDPISKEVTPVLTGAADAGGAMLSRDGRWIAYVSGETGRQEIYIRPYPNLDADRIIVTSTGGRAPFWTTSGRELIFIAAGGTPMRMSVATRGEKLVLGTPEVFVADDSWPRALSVTPSHDGSRLLTVIVPDSVANLQEYRVILNWFEELKARVK